MYRPKIEWRKIAHQKHVHYIYTWAVNNGLISKNGVISKSVWKDNDWDVVDMLVKGNPMSGRFMEFQDWYNFEIIRETCSPRNSYKHFSYCMG